MSCWLVSSSLTSLPVWELSHLALIERPDPTEAEVEQAAHEVLNERREPRPESVGMRLRSVLIAGENR
jgi:hypothetical protein